MCPSPAPPALEGWAAWLCLCPQKGTPKSPWEGAVVGTQRAACSEKTSRGVWLTSGFQIFSPSAEGSCEAVAGLGTGVCRSDLCASTPEDRFGDEEGTALPRLARGTPRHGRCLKVAQGRGSAGPRTHPRLPGSQTGLKTGKMENFHKMEIPAEKQRASLLRAVLRSGSTQPG